MADGAAVEKLPISLHDALPIYLTIATVPARVAGKGDPWAAMNDHPQSIEPLLAMSQRDRESGLMDAPWPPVYPDRKSTRLNSSHSQSSYAVFCFKKKRHGSCQI